MWGPAVWRDYSPLKSDGRLRLATEQGTVTAFDSERKTGLSVSVKIIIGLSRWGRNIFINYLANSAQFARFTSVFFAVLAAQVSDTVLVNWLHYRLEQR